VWAPAVTATGHGGYLLYFTARGQPHTHCIGVARAGAPEGPFQPSGSQPLVCRPGDVNAVDPKPFTDTDGAHYLLYSASREGNDTVWLQQLTWRRRR
jgi:arabinan endo-1,5-alpha-L-arabinosidase